MAGKQTFSRCVLHFDYGFRRIETFGEMTEIPAEEKKGSSSNNRKMAK